MLNKYPICHVSRLRMGSDGDGIRSLILVSECTLRCKYCINPFTWDGSQQPQMLSADEVYSKICIDRPYIMATNGGITFGGGEPLLYPHLINDIRNICEPDMSFYVETSLNVDWENIETSAEVVDKYYVDIKTMDPDMYREYTGGELEVALSNLKKLIERFPDSVVVRLPEIPGLVDKEKQKKGQRLLQEIGIKKINLFKYRIT